MLVGELYAAMEPALVNGRAFAQVCLKTLNDSSPLDVALRNQTTLELLGTKGKSKFCPKKNLQRVLLRFQIQVDLKLFTQIPYLKV